MRRILLALSALFTASMFVRAESAGISAAVDLSVLEQAKQLYFDMIVDAINQVELDNYSFNKNRGYLKKNSFRIT